MVSRSKKTGAFHALDVEEVLRIYEAVVEDFSDTDEPIAPAGLRDRGLLESAVNRQHTGFGGIEKYATVFEKAASLFYGICNNHSFYNGNKRCALVSMLVALDANGYLLLEDDAPLFELVAGTASHTLLPLKREAQAESDEEVRWLAAWIKRRSRPVVRGERPLPFRTFRKILSRFGFEFGSPDKGFIDLRRGETRYRVVYHGEGHELTQGALAHVRRDLELDESHGYDGRVFYNGAGQTGAFIVKYRRVLRDLANA